MLLLLSALISTVAAIPGTSGSSLSCWASAGFSRLPCAEGYEPSDPTATLFAPDARDFFSLVDAYLASQRAVLGDPARWPLDDGAFVSRRVSSVLAPLRPVAPPTLLPHVARLEVPPNATVALYGDLHGSFHSLLRSLWAHSDAGRLDAATLRTAPGFFMLFLGDYVDRGSHGTETLALLLALKAANPGSVVLVRGNHEDLALNTRPGDFAEELARKFPAAEPDDLLRAAQRVYDTLPMAVFLGGSGGGGGGDAARHVQGCHGGLEVGVDPLPLLRAPAPPHGAAGGAAGLAFSLVHGFARRDWAEKHRVDAPHLKLGREIERLMSNWGLPLQHGGEAAPEERGVGALAEGSVGGWGEGGAALARARAAAAAAAARWDDATWPLQPLDTDPANGYLWADFIVDQPLRVITNQPGRGLAYGLKLTDAVLARYGLVGVFRAHQHNDAREVGPMLTRVVAGGGAYVNWGGTGHVTTLLSGAGTVGFAKDAHALLRTPGADPGGWSLSLCGNAPGRPLAAARAAAAAEAALEGPLAPGACAGTFEFARGDGGAAPPRNARGEGARHCNPAHEFTCEALPWHPAALP